MKKAKLATQEQQAPAKRSKLSQADVPGVSLSNALRIPQAIFDNYAGGAVTSIQLAQALQMTPTSGPFRTLCGAAIAYGLTSGGYNAGQIVVEPLARKIFRPTTEGEDAAAKREAFLTPRVINEFLNKYNGHALPASNIAQNVLAAIGVPEQRTKDVLQLILEGADNLGFVTSIKDKRYIQLANTNANTVKAVVITDASPAGEEELDVEQFDALPKEREINRAPSTNNPEKPKQLFIAHGKNHKPLEDLKKVLDQFKIPYKVAVDEANAGRPISKKVAQLMRECSAGVFIFTKDEAFKDKADQEVWRPSENVVYELGAANILWENKIIILRENGVNFPSDFSDLGYISFDGGNLKDKALDLLKELIALELVRLQAA